MNKRSSHIIVKDMKLENSTLSPQDQILILKFAGYKILSYADWMNRSGNFIETWNQYYRQLTDNDEGFIVIDKSGNCGWPHLAEVGVLLSMLVQNDIKFSINFNPNSFHKESPQWVVWVEGHVPKCFHNLHKGLLEQILKLAKKQNR